MRAEEMISGGLYLVSTPIGHLAEISPRAVDVLHRVDVILCEDTRHSARLLQHCHIHTQVWSFHQHNQGQQVSKVLSALQQGQTFALISDAGMPLISDPGHPLVQACHAAGYRVIPVSGPSAVISAAAVSGLCVNGFSFIGFLPTKRGARQAVFAEMVQHPRAWLFFEAPHRMSAMVEDLAQVLPMERRVLVARELTKHYEEVMLCTVQSLCERVRSGAFQRGELVIVVEAAPAQVRALTPDLKAMIAEMRPRLTTSEIVKWLHALTQVPKKALYQAVIEVPRKGDD